MLIGSSLAITPVASYSKYVIKIQEMGSYMW